MQQFLRLIDAAGYAFLALALLCLWRIKHSSGDGRNLRLLARISSGCVLFFVGISIVLPKIASPRIESAGVVSSFHEVNEYRSSHFEFRINGRDPNLSAFYFDKGFYFGDPSVSDGDTVELEYLSWTNQVLRLQEISGRHPGWKFEEEPKPLGPWLVVLGGILLIFGGIWGKLTDVVARPDRTPGPDLSGRGLG